MTAKLVSDCCESELIEHYDYHFNGDYTPIYYTCSHCLKCCHSKRIEEHEDGEEK